MRSDLHEENARACNADRFGQNTSPSCAALGRFEGERHAAAFERASAEDGFGCRLRPHCGTHQDKFPSYLGCFQLVHNACRRGKVPPGVRIVGLAVRPEPTPRNPTRASADCLVRFASAHHRMVRNINLNVSGQAVLTYAPTEFRLEPGLFLLAVAVGCWRGDHVAGAGEATVVVRHPGEAVLKPATANEVIRPAPRGAGGEDVNAAQAPR